MESWGHALLGAVSLSALATAHSAQAMGDATCRAAPVLRSLAVREDVACGDDLGLLASLGKPPLVPGACISKLVPTVRELNAKLGFGFRVIYRPAPPEDDGRLLEINPHLRNDVKVCARHQIDLYVGRWPFRPMPDQAFSGQPVGQAEAVLQAIGFKPELRCTDGEIKMTNKDLPVAAQWPQPGQLLGADVPMSRFRMQDQQPLLLVECAAKDLPRCPQPEKCPLPPDPPPPGPPLPHVPQGDSSVGDVALGGAAGLAGGMLLARFLRGQAPSSPKPTPKGAPPIRAMVVRVRHDIDSTDPTEARRGPDDA